MTWWQGQLGAHTSDSSLTHLATCGSGKRQDGVLVRRHILSSRRWPARVRITTDSIPWGFGAWLEVDRQPKEFISEAWSDEDCKYFGHERGSSDGQQTWEALAALLAIRVWLPEYRDEKLKLVILSDSKATLAVVGKERSKSARLNTIAREKSLDLAQNSQGLELQTCHVAGTENQWADALSRVHEPGQAYTVPNELAHLRRRAAPVRCDRFWKTQVPCWIMVKSRTGFGVIRLVGPNWISTSDIRTLRRYHVVCSFGGKHSHRSGRFCDTMRLGCGLLRSMFRPYCRRSGRFCDTIRLCSVESVH